MDPIDTAVGRTCVPENRRGRESNVRLRNPGLENQQLSVADDVAACHHRPPGRKSDPYVRDDPLSIAVEYRKPVRVEAKLDPGRRDPVDAVRTKHRNTAVLEIDLPDASGSELLLESHRDTLSVVEGSRNVARHVLPADARDVHPRVEKQFNA